jgi:hypothetical protein
MILRDSYILTNQLRFNVIYRERNSFRYKQLVDAEALKEQV